MILSINVILICITLFIVIFSVVLSQNNRSICMPHGNLTQTDKTLNTLDLELFCSKLISTHENENVFYSSTKLPVKIDLSSLSLNGKMLIFIFRFKVC